MQLHTLHPTQYNIGKIRPVNVFIALPALSVNLSGRTTTLPVWKDDFLHVVGHEKIIETSELIPLQECFLSPEGGRQTHRFVQSVCIPNNTTNVLANPRDKEPRCRTAAPSESVRLRHYCHDQSHSRPLTRSISTIVYVLLSTNKDSDCSITTGRESILPGKNLTEDTRAVTSCANTFG